MSEDKKAESGSGRWWEFYFVRYALGTLIGAIIVRVLATTGLSYVFPGMNTLDLNATETYPLLLAYGLTFCYFASAPVLVFHAGRFSTNQRTIELKPTIYSALIAVLLALLWAFLELEGHSKEKDLSFAELALVLVTLSVFLMVIMNQIRTIWITQNNIPKMWEFTKEVDLRRRRPENKELVNSYRHLREHGNAFLVVSCEILLAFSLWVATHYSLIPPSALGQPQICSITASKLAPEPNSQQKRADLGQPQTDKNSGKLAGSGQESCQYETTALVQLLALLALWLVPAAFIWSIGCRMERAFSEEPIPPKHLSSAAPSTGPTPPVGP